MSDETAKITEQLPTVDQKSLVCSVSSRIADEQLFGTISQTQVWFLLEYLAPPLAKAFEESDLSQPVKDYLSAILKSIPQSRLLLIRQKSTFSNGTGPTFFVAAGSDTSPGLYEFHLDRYEALPHLDLARLVSNPGPTKSSAVSIRCFWFAQMGGEMLVVLTWVSLPIKGSLAPLETTPGSPPTLAATVSQRMSCVFHTALDTGWWIRGKLKTW
jgi:hypothetical protein